MPEQSTRKYLEARIRELENKLAKQKQSGLLLRQVVDKIPFPIFAKNIDGQFIFLNQIVAENLGRTVEEVTGRSHADLYPDNEELEKMLSDDRKTIESNEMLVIPEESYTLPGGETSWWHTIKVPFKHVISDEPALLGISIDITDRKQMEKDLIKSHESLETKVQERTTALEDMNSALTVLLKKREEDKEKTEQKIISNYKSLIMPFVEKLKNTLTLEKQNNLMMILESNLEEFLEPFTQKLSDPLVNLTPTEIQIASMIKQGLSNKEMAKILNNSIRTITNHRQHIRTKLGLKNKKINLRSYLSSL